ncbi:MAG: hypothetical protein KGJ23_07995 [Euryarchaeota archaeon]|nr:hypothetical protein [Euryarchaeota archaeon]MDE1836542.1 hypothetical protein [Euryarchaeota archaeon]MDE1879263.1 hypothetical protein [Euryarchaeota archaeon]MDE2044512.1 hypothetical protein [Thermoplasmata archaeon]
MSGYVLTVADIKAQMRERMRELRRRLKEGAGKHRFDEDAANRERLRENERLYSTIQALERSQG